MRNSAHNRPIATGDQVIYAKPDPLKARIDTLRKIAMNRQDSEPKRIWACEILIRDCGWRHAEKIYEEITGREFEYEVASVSERPTSAAKRQAERDAARMEALKARQRAESEKRGQKNLVARNRSLKKKRVKRRVNNQRRRAQKAQ